MSNQTNSIQSVVDSIVKEFSDLKEVRSTIEELLELKKQSELINEEINIRKSKLMEIYAQKKAEERDEFEDKVAELCNILSESLHDRDREKRMIVLVEKDYRLLRVYSQESNTTLSVFESTDDDIEALTRWVNLQIESASFYRLLLTHFRKKLMSANLQKLTGIRLNDLEWLEFKYQTDTDSVKIIHRSLITYNQVVDMISDAYRDGREFQASGIVDSYEIVLTSSKETICNVSDFVETVEKIELSSK